MDSRSDIFVTTAARETPVLRETAHALARELHCAFLPRRGAGLPALFAAHSETVRAVVVQTERLLLIDRDGHTFFAHPGIGYLRFGNLLLSGRDTLLDASGAKPGDRVLDCTLGFAAEATLFAHASGDTGVVHGVEAVPEVGVVVRAGLQSVVTKQEKLNAAMRRVQVVHLGSHRDYLRTCADKSYDVVYFDPFFDTVLEDSLSFAPLRVFGDHTRLAPETLADAVRVARRCVVVKTTRWGDTFAELGITERVESKNGKVTYGVVAAGTEES